MRIGLFSAIAFAAVILDSALAPEIEILGARPDLLVLVVVYGSLLVGGRQAIVAGFLMGVASDADIPSYLGLNALALSITGLATFRVWNHLVRASVLVQCAVIFAATLLHDVIYYLGYYRNHLDMFGRFIIRYSIPGALYTAAIGVVIYALARALGLREVSGGSLG
ncbi:MAG: rod shape-determining protein MreD [Candidatus Eisenbacteria bacterium]|nr:rod shape-determining protein MreD [Candidatus Eisenbacteria bacterium]